MRDTTITKPRRAKPCDTKPCPNGCGGICTRSASQCLACRKAAPFLSVKVDADGNRLLANWEVRKTLGLTYAALDYHIKSGRLMRADASGRGSRSFYRREDVERLRQFLALSPKSRKRVPQSKHRAEQPGQAVVVPLEDTASPLLTAIKQGKELPGALTGGFWIVYRPLLREYRVVEHRAPLQTGEKRVLEYVPGLHFTRHSAVWNVYAAPLTGNSIAVIANKLDRLEQSAGRSVV